MAAQLSEDTDAERLAAEYDFDADLLLSEANRRSFGSFTTTLDGSPRERDRFWRAFEIAIRREQAFARHQEVYP